MKIYLGIFAVSLVFLFIFFPSVIIKKTEPTLGRTRPGLRMAEAFIRCRPGAREPSRPSPQTLRAAAALPPAAAAAPPPIRRSRASPEVRRPRNPCHFFGKKIPFVVFLFRRIFPRLFFDRDFRSDFRFSITFRSFIGIRRFKRLEFRLETLFPNNQLKQVFATVKFDIDLDY